MTVTGEGGLRALTHRAVDARAGQPPGSASYWFRTRGDLIAATLGHLAETDEADLARAAVPLADGDGVPLADGDRPAAALAGLLLTWLGPDRVRTLARMELFLAAARDPALQPALARWRAGFRALARPLAGSDRAALLLVAAVDGLLLDRLTRPADPYTAAAALADARALLAADLTDPEPASPDV